MDKLRLAVVGCGDIAGYTAWLSRLIPRITLAACCDANPERARAFARRHRIAQVFTDYTELLDKARADALYIAVPHHLHYEMILAACQAGKPVLAEKPLTRILDEGLRLCASIDQLGIKAGVNYQYRYDSGCYALAHAMQHGELGKIHSVRINLPWRRSANYFDQAAWHKTIAQAGGGTLITQGSHFLDVALWGLGEQPKTAMGYTATPTFQVEVDTLAHGIVETQGGTLISITSSMVAASEQAVTIEVYGERGTGLYRSLPLPRVKFIGAKVRGARPPEWGLHALQRSLSGFVHWVLDDKPFLTPAASTLSVLAALNAIYVSAQTGQRTNIAHIETLFVVD